MNIDLLPLSAFALQSSRGPDRLLAEPQTLTLRLTPRTTDCAQPPLMGGNASIASGSLQPKGVLRAAVLPADGPGITITF